MFACKMFSVSLESIALTCIHGDVTTNGEEYKI